MRLPITTSILYALGRALSNKTSNKTEALLWAVLRVGFYGALRCGESTAKKDSDVYLCYEDVCLLFDDNAQRECAHLRLKVSKTDPFRKGCTILLYATGREACPVAALRSYLSMEPPHPPAFPLFHLPNGSPLTRSVYLRLLQDSLIKAGFPASQYNGHSLRKDSQIPLALVTFLIT